MTPLQTLFVIFTYRYALAINDFNGKSLINGGFNGKFISMCRGFSIAMFDYRRVPFLRIHILTSGVMTAQSRKHHA